MITSLPPLGSLPGGGARTPRVPDQEIGTKAPFPAQTQENPILESIEK